MKGRDYRALRRLSNAANETLAEVGETCDRVPPESLPWLLQSGKIEPVIKRRRRTAAPEAEPSADANGEWHWEAIPTEDLEVIADEKDGRDV